MRKELEKEQGSADKVTIRGTSDSLLNLPAAACDGLTPMKPPAAPEADFVVHASVYGELPIGLPAK